MESSMRVSALGSRGHVCDRRDTNRLRSPTENGQSQVIAETAARLESTRNRPGLFRWIYESGRNKFTLLNVLYFGGALTIIAAMSLFMTVGWGARGRMQSSCRRCVLLSCVLACPSNAQKCSEAAESAWSR
jgi:hypothetical protein